MLPLYSTHHAPLVPDWAESFNTFSAANRCLELSYRSCPPSGDRNLSYFILAPELRTSSSSSFEGHPLQARHKQDWGRVFILLLPQTAALPGSDAGSDVIKPASSFVIQNRQTSCSMWCPMYRTRC